MVIYVDYNLTVGHPDAIVDTIEQLKKNGFVVKVEDDSRDYLYCEIWFNSDRAKAWIEKPHFLTNLERKFGKGVYCMRGTKTPGTPSFRIVCGMIEDEMISSEKQNYMVRMLECCFT